MSEELRLEQEHRLRNRIRTIALLLWIAGLLDLYFCGIRVLELRYGVPQGLGQSVGLAAVSAVGLLLEGVLLLLVGWHGLTDPGSPRRQRGPIMEGSLAVVTELVVEPVLVVRSYLVGENMILVLLFTFIQILMTIRYRGLRRKFLNFVCRNRRLGV